MTNYARNYGVVFFAYGIGAILGGIISGQAKDVFGTYTFAFYPTAVMAAVGLCLAALLMKPPKKHSYLFTLRKKKRALSPFFLLSL